MENAAFLAAKINSCLFQLFWQSSSARPGKPIARASDFLVLQDFVPAEESLETLRMLK